MWVWLLLLGLIVFFMYMVNPFKKTTSGGCNTCAKKKNVSRETCSELERFQDQVLEHDLDIYSTGSNSFLEKNKMGVGHLKVGWEFDRKKVRNGKSFEFKTIDKVFARVS